MSQLFASGGQSIGVSASALVLLMNIQDWFPLGWTGWVSLQSKGVSSLLQHHSIRASVLRHSAFFIVQLSHPYVSTGQTTALMRWTFVGKVMSLLFNMLSRLVVIFFQGVSVFLFHGCSHHLQWFLEPPKIELFLGTKGKWQVCPSCYNARYCDWVFTAVQWKRIRLPAQGTLAQSPVREIRSQMPWSKEVCLPQLLSPCSATTEATPMKSPCIPTREPLLTTSRENPHHDKDPAHP